MNCYIVLDGGTTNTRLYLVQKKTLDSQKIPVGSGNAENKELLREAIRLGIEDLLNRNGMRQDDVHCVIASGTITSELGLCLVPHICVPAGIAELHENMYRTQFPDISPIPFVFIPGIRVNSDNLMLADMMRGEETELFGLLEKPEADCLYVLPGSHNKLIAVDDRKKICSIRTMLTGEMLAALSQYTILKAAVDMSNAQIQEESLLQGYACCEKLGMNEALFKVRVMKNLFAGTADAVYSYFLGIVLHGDVRNILSCDVKKVIVGGQNKMQDALVRLLKNKTSLPVIRVEQQQVQDSVVQGAIRIYEYSPNEK